MVNVQEARQMNSREGVDSAEVIHRELVQEPSSVQFPLQDSTMYRRSKRTKPEKEVGNLIQIDLDNNPHDQTKSISRKRGRPPKQLNLKESKQMSTDCTNRKVSLCGEVAIESIATRKTQRNPAQSMLERRDVQKMLHNIRNNDPSTIVFKVKEHVFADINAVVFDAIVDALAVNKVCQAIYIQNLSNAIHDDQVRHLIKVLKKKKIWCVNIGENYEVSTRMWEEFCARLPETFVTHLYVSEHVIPLPLKNLMREHIRHNRKKHQLHCAFKNLAVIERCTNMWWNPINGVKELKPYVAPAPSTPEISELEHKTVMRKSRADNPNDVAYWQQGVGKGGEKPWKFKCSCGEECSSYENCRYHPTGRMFECTVCHFWSHVDCVFGENKVSDNDLEEMEEVLCRPCQHRYRRSIKRLCDGDSVISHDKIPSASALLGAPGAVVTLSSDSKRQKLLHSSVVLTRVSVHEEKKSTTPWKFKCICGEVCSSYEKELYHPRGAIYPCSQCKVRSHVVCMLGPQVTQEEANQLQDLLCGTCRSKQRRSRRERTEDSHDNALQVPSNEVEKTILEEK
jgi:hypothetical protein